MFRPFGIFLISLVAATGCSARSDSAPPPAAEQRAELPRGAILGPSGYATIIDAPPAPFTASAPAEPPPPSAEQVRGHEQFARAGAFQNKVMAEVTALNARLRSAERGNFVSLYFDNEAEPSVVFQFLRNGPATLARYTRNPRFFGKTVRFSEQQLEEASSFMWKTFGSDRVLESTGIGRNTMTARLSVPEAEFRALVARKGVKIPEAVELEFAASRPAAEVNRPLAPAIARLLRIFPRDDRPLGILHSINSRAKVELRDGCFRLPDQGGALALFPLGANLFIDGEGYLAFAPGGPGYGRVGETLVFPGSIGEVTAPELVGPIHAACGPGRVLKITATRSAAAEQAQSSVTENRNSLRQLRASYGLSEAEAQRVLERCKAQMGGDRCVLTPPPPVPNPKGCPPGTKLSFGLCRTPEGFIRPIPDWLLRLMGGSASPR